MKSWPASAVIGGLLLLATIAWLPYADQGLLWPFIGLLIAILSLTGLLVACKRGSHEWTRRIKSILILLFFIDYLCYAFYRATIGVNVGMLATLFFVIIVLQIRIKEVLRLKAVIS